MSYTKMFEKGKIGRLELKNRIVMPAMGCSLAWHTKSVISHRFEAYPSVNTFSGSSPCV